MTPYNLAKTTAETAAERVEVLTPHNTNEVSAFIPRGIYVGGAGNVTLRAIGSSVDTVFTNVPAGSVLKVRAQFVRATGTTATNMLLLI